MKTKLLILLAILGLSSYVYACRTVMINTPTGTTVCYICADGKIITCEPL